MKIRPKILIYSGGGVSGVGRTVTDWYNHIHMPQRGYILDRLKRFGEGDNYMYWLNAMQHFHSEIYNKNKDKVIRPEEDEDVANYQKAYSGDYDKYPSYSYDEGTIKRYLLPIGEHDNYNKYGIENAFDKKIFTYPGKRTSKDTPEWNYVPDGLYSGITDYRRLLGRKGDWDEASQEFKEWLTQLNNLGYETYLDDTDKYYKLRRLPHKENFVNNSPEDISESSEDTDETTKIKTAKRKYGFDWDKFKEGLNSILGNPNIYAVGRLSGNLINNERVYGEVLKGINPVLKQTYNTHRQVIGDEGTKQAFYKRAAQGLSKAGIPVTSDSDKQMAYMFEAKRVGDELREKGDLADNQEIRRTSDESNQHQWDNILRATEVANANIASINQANSLKHNLLALKHSALWTSVDNFLKGIENRKRKQLAELLAIDDQIFSLTQEQELLYNKDVIAAREKYKRTIDLHKLSDGVNIDWDNDDVLEAINELKTAIVNAKIKVYLEKKKHYLDRGLIDYSKSGSKITRKTKDDLLYKSTKDSVEHFRKMSKMSSDSYDRKTPKIERLAPHPKGKKTRKYLLGGLAPFTIYTPVALGGETTTSTENSSTSTKESSSKKGKDDDTLDMIKELFKLIVGKGLPSDLNSVYLSMSNFLARSRALGEDLSTSDLASMYLALMSRLNKIQYLKEEFDNAKKIAVDNDAINEIAVNSDGSLMALDKNGKLTFVDSVNDAKEKGLNLVTNNLLLILRALSPAFAERVDLTGVIANGVGVSKITEFIKSINPKLGTRELTNEGYTKVEAGKILSGFELLKDAPKGHYKYTDYTKDLKELILLAINYIDKSLPRNMKAVLKAHAEIEGTTYKEIIGSLVGSGVDYENRRTYLSITNNKEDENSLDKVKSNPLLNYQREIGGTPITYSLITRDSSTRLSVNGTNYSSLNKVKDDMSIEEMLSLSGIDGILDSKYGITFGDLQINPEHLKDIMYSNSGNNIIVTLPCKIVNGHKQVNLAVREAYERAELKALKVAPRGSKEFLEALGKELKGEHLDSLLDSNGYPNKNMFMQFLVVEAYASDRIPFEDKKSQYIEKVREPSADLEQRMSKALSTDSKKSNYKLDVEDKWPIFEWRYDDIYRGNVFIPLNNNPMSALIDSGNSIKQSLDLEELYQISNKSANYNKENSY